MADGAPDRYERDAPVNPYSLLESVNASGRSAHSSWLILVAILTYVAIAAAAVTHEDLLLGRAVMLPILQAPVQLEHYFAVAPVVVALVHLGVAAQLVLVANKAIEFDRAVRLLEINDRRLHPLRLELNTVFFLQAIAGPRRPLAVGAVLHAMIWLSVVAAPIALLLYLQLAFLPHHDAATTWSQRAALTFDLVSLTAVGAFFLRNEWTFGEAITRNAQMHPVSAALTAALILSAAFVSYFVATLPGERLDRTVRVVSGAAGPAAGGYAFPQFAISADGALFGLFRRNLFVTDTDVAGGRGARLVLRGRDLRFATLDRSNLAGADVTSADLTGASLVSANLSGARLNAVRASGATFVDADLDAADLRSVEAIGANFQSAAMAGANLAGAVLIGADLSSASLTAATLTGAQLDGASLQGADLEAAVVDRASVLGTDLSSARAPFSDWRGAAIWLTSPPRADPSQASDFREADLAAPNDEDRARLAKAIEQSKTSTGASRIREALAALMGDRGKNTWADTSAHAGWQALAAPSIVPEDALRQQLTDRLSELMCGSQRAGVATGIVRRALADAFAGDPARIVDRLKREDCAGGRLVDPRLAADLSRGSTGRAAP